MRLMVAAFAAGLVVSALWAEAPPNPVERLQSRIDSGEVELVFRPGQGYLQSLLEAFDIPISSQALVFSKTSAQFRLISPQSPRAVYFNDDVYVGFVRGGPILEISVADPAGGGAFYTLHQTRDERPAFQPDNGMCLQCHESARTQGIPGHLTRSVYPDQDGLPLFRFGTIDVDQKTPLPERWGGWYVTGKAAGLTHRANVVLSSENDEEAAAFEQGKASELEDLHGLFDIEAYLTPHSDIVAHLVMEHQTQMHNRIGVAALEARRALEYRDEMIARFGEPSPELLASVKRRIEGPAERLVEFLFFKDEAPLAGPVEGGSAFAAEFQSLGPKDSQGRSLRELDLERRLLKYPLSYLIYTESFDALPQETLVYVYRRMDEVLSGPAPGYEHLSDQDRRAIREILTETKPSFAARAKSD